MCLRHHRHGFAMADRIAANSGDVTTSCVPVSHGGRGYSSLS